MSERYPFASDKTLIASDGTVVWNEQITVQSLNFANVSNTSLSDSLSESYASAVEINDNETQYLSVLETTNDITLEDLHNLTLGSTKVEMQENLEFNDEDQLENTELTNVDIGDQQVVVFRVDGSEDLYGIQFAQDEEGNMQRYQFKFRTTEDGQLEAIPESVQLLFQEEEIQPNSAVLVEAESDETQIILQEGDVEENQVFLQNQENAEHIVEQELEEQNERTIDFITIKGEPEQQTLNEEQEYLQHQQESDENVEEHEDLDFNNKKIQLSDENQLEDATIDVKAGILEESIALRETISTSSNIKEELLQEESQNPSDDEETEDSEYQIYQQQDTDIQEETIQEHQIAHELQVEQLDDNYEAVETNDQETILEYQHYVPERIQQVYEQTEKEDAETIEQLQPENHYEQLFIQEKHISEEEPPEEMGDDYEEEEVEEQFVTETANENDSDNDDYQIVEGLHITAEGDIGEDSISEPFQEPETILQEVIEKSVISDRANILKQPSIIKNVKDIKPKDNKTIVYYVVPRPEKENVNSLPVNNTAAYRPARSNPRSILKSSFTSVKEDSSVKMSRDERLNKRFARSKEAMQARLFNNFISKTTIPHAPVRQNRLPRKQQIKPVDTRRDEEIIVQEVMVSSNGFIENIEEKLRNKAKLEITGYVELTDSDDDYDPKQGNKKKKKYRKHKRANTSDSNDSDTTSIIEILQSDEEEDIQKEKDNMKRGRGRPRKSIDVKENSDNLKRRRGRPPKLNQNQTETESSPLKKSRTESDEIDSDTGKKEIKCPHCTKTFPSPNSLSTHIQHHNLENSLRNSQACKIATKSTIIEYKYKCENCQVTFKNSVLLNRHVCQKETSQTKKYICSFCKMKFSDISILNIHKRSHIKENLVKTTTIPKVSPKKFIPKPPSSFKPTNKVTTTKTLLKCKECSKVCSSQTNLSVHEKSHKRFKCVTCSATFSSRLLLDTHVRVNCVKPMSPKNKRLSFKIKRSFVHSPKKNAGKVITTNTALNWTADQNRSMKIIQVDCETCNTKFSTNAALFKHKVKVHGLETPDKNVLAKSKKLIHNPKTVHGGIPANDRLRKAFSGLRGQMELTMKD